MKFGFESFKKKESSLVNFKEQIKEIVKELEPAIKKAQEENIDIIITLLKEIQEGRKFEQPPESLVELILKLRELKFVSRKAAKFLIKELKSEDQSRKEYVQAAVNKIFEDAYGD